MRLKTADQIAKMPIDALRRAFANQQVKLAEWERFEAGSGNPDLFDVFDEQIRSAKRIANEVRRDLRGLKQGPYQLVHRAMLDQLRERAERGLARVMKARRDAEKPERDHLPGIEMLRSWLRRIHMDIVGGWDQDTPQNAIAELLGEYPGGHERQFTLRSSP